MPRVIAETLRRVRRLSAADWADVVSAQIALFSAQRAVARRPVGQLVSPAPSDTAEESTVLSPPDPRAARFARAVNRAATYGVFRPRCLVRALALNRLLEAQGITGSWIRIGVRWDDGRFTAHAWVEYRQRPLGDPVEHVTPFAALADVRAVDFA